MIYYVFVVLGILACSLSQLMLKKSASQPHHSRIAEIVNPQVIVAYIILLGSLFINIWAMSNGLQLKEMAILESLGYVFVPLLSVVLLGEKVNRRMVSGILLIMAGILVFYQ